MLWLWGALGAFIFASNACLFRLWNRGARIRAVVEFVAAIITGGICAQGLTAMVQAQLQGGVKVDRIATALTIGWACNYLWPKLLRKLSKRIDEL